MFPCGEYHGPQPTLCANVCLYLLPTQTVSRLNSFSIDVQNMFPPGLNLVLPQQQRDPRFC